MPRRCCSSSLTLWRRKSLTLFSSPLWPQEAGSIMLSRLSKLIPAAVLALALVFPSGFVSAQEPAAPKAETSPTATSQEKLVHRANEASGEDQNDSFRHSAA